MKSFYTYEWKRKWQLIEFLWTINEIFLLPILNLDCAFNFFGQFSKSIRKDYKTKVHIRHEMSMNSFNEQKKIRFNIFIKMGILIALRIDGLNFFYFFEVCTMNGAIIIKKRNILKKFFSISFFEYFSSTKQRRRKQYFQIIISNPYWNRVFGNVKFMMSYEFW